MREATGRRCECQSPCQSQAACARSNDHRGADHRRSARRDAMTKRLVYICDWLPPDFGAVGQYAVLFARQWASEGCAVTLVGLTSGKQTYQPAEPVGDGSLEVLRIHRRLYKKHKSISRLIWTIASNLALL